MNSNRFAKVLTIGCLMAVLFCTACSKSSLIGSETKFSESLLISETEREPVETTIIETSPTPTPTPTPTPEPQHILVSFTGDCTLAEAVAWNGSPDGFDAVVNGDYTYCFRSSNLNMS